MAYNVASLILITWLLIIWTAQAETPPNKDMEGDVIAAIVGVNRTREMFGDVYKQAVLFYKDPGDDLAELKKLPELMKQLRNEISDLKNPNKPDNTQVTAMEEKLKRMLNLLAEQLNINKLVKEYDNSKDWRALRKGLEVALDHDSPAYKQLQAISWSEQNAPWRIAYEGHTELVSVLVFAGNGIDMRDGTQNNFLHGAVAGGQKELVEMLLDNGADIESGNGWGNRPLALACKYGRLAVARLLWARGAQVDGVNRDEKWAGLARAADEGYLEIVKFMVQIGASTTIKDRDGRTPLEVAQRKGHTAIVEYLSQFPH